LFTNKTAALKRIICFLSCILISFLPVAATGNNPGMTENKMIPADNINIQYTGRIDFTDPEKPRFWSPGVYIKARYHGSFCELVMRDEL
jgi:hypothetical protein